MGYIGIVIKGGGVVISVALSIVSLAGFEPDLDDSVGDDPSVFMTMSRLASPETS